MSDATLITCTNAKRDEPAAAKDLYDESTYFRKMRAWAEARGGPWYILSAKHGLLKPNRHISPYDETGLSLPQAEAVASRLDSIGVTRVYVCAGAAYLGTLEPALEAFNIEVVDPFNGLQIGDRMSELESRTK